MNSSNSTRMQAPAHAARRITLFAFLAILGLAFSVGCASKQTWPDLQRSAETKMFTIQGKIGDGLKSGALTPDQSQGFLASLKLIRTDYEALSGTRIYKKEWNELHSRLDSLDAEITRSYARTTGTDARDGDRIGSLQGRIDDGRLSGRLPLTESRDFQSRLDSIRRDYFRMTEGNRDAPNGERLEISRRLDSLEADLNRFR